MIVLITAKECDRIDDGVTVEEVEAFLAKRARLRNMAPPPVVVSAPEQIETQVAEKKEGTKA